MVDLIQSGRKPLKQLTLSILAEEQGQIVGHVALSPVVITETHGHQTTDWQGLGPISVLTARQGQGLGSRLMRQAIAELREMHVTGCVLLGEPVYYARFGFEAHAGLKLPGVPIWLLALNAGGRPLPRPDCISQRRGRSLSS